MASELAEQLTSAGAGVEPSSMYELTAAEMDVELD